MTENLIVSPKPSAHPLVFFFLVLPFGIVNGYVVVTFGYLLSQVGISKALIAAIVSSALLPQMFKFLWAPIVDITLSVKRWYILSAVLTALCIFVMGILPINNSSLPMITLLVVLMNVTVSFNGIAVSSLAAHDTPDESKGNVSGFYNAGNLGGSGLGGALGLFMAEYVKPIWLSSVTLAVICVLCCLALYFIQEVPPTLRTQKVGTTILNVFKDVWATIKARTGLLALILSFLPLSTGAASNLWAGVADGWHAGANTVIYVTGALNGLITAVGCLIGGWICDRMNRQNAYILFGVMQVLCALGMAYSPHTELMYIIWITLYSITLGFAYAGFSAFVLEAIGKGAAGTKYNLYASLSNFPIWYLGIFEGIVYDKYGPTGMLDTEAIAGIIGIIVFFILVKFIWVKRQTTPVEAV